MKTIIHIALMILLLTVSNATVLGKRSDGSDDSLHEIKGKIEQVSEEKTGIWIVNGREISVTEATFIDEEHGDAVPGAFVEVKGSRVSGKFIATKIEVKRLSRK